MIFLEPKRLYNGPFDGHHDKPVVPWSQHALGEVPEGHYTVPLDRRAVFRARQRRDGADLRHDGLRREAAASETGIDAEIIDLRSLWPLDLPTIVASVKKTGRCVVVHEATRTSGFGAELVGAGAGALLLPPRSADRARHRLGHALPACAGVGLFPRPGARGARRCSARWRHEHGSHVDQDARPRRRHRRGRGRGLACQGRRHGGRGPGAGRRDDRQGHGRDPVAGGRHGARARRRGRRGAGGRRRADPHRSRRATARPRSAGAAPRAEAAAPAPSRRRAPAPARSASGGRTGTARTPPRSRSRTAPQRAPPATSPIASPAVRATRLGARHRPARGARPAAPAGRIMQADLDAHVAAARRTRPRAARRRARRAQRRRRRSEIKVIGLRRRIAQKMQESKRRIPHFTYVEEVDVTELEALRARLNAQWGAERGQLTLLPFLMRAIVLAVREFPQVNARFDDEAGVLTRHGAVHIGIATQTDAGLMVPVLRHAQARDLWAMRRGDRRGWPRRRAAASATRDELTGSTITMTSLGALGGIVSTPVINQPEVAIVGVNRIVAAADGARRRRRAAADDEPVVVVRPPRRRRRRRRRASSRRCASCSNTRRACSSTERRLRCSRAARCMSPSRTATASGFGGGRPLPTRCGRSRLRLPLRACIGAGSGHWGALLRSCPPASACGRGLLLYFAAQGTPAA